MGTWDSKKAVGANWQQSTSGISQKKNRLISALETLLNSSIKHNLTKFAEQFKTNQRKFSEYTEISVSDRGARTAFFHIQHTFFFIPEYSSIECRTFLISKWRKPGKFRPFDRY